MTTLVVAWFAARAHPPPPRSVKRHEGRFSQARRYCYWCVTHNLAPHNHDREHLRQVCVSLHAASVAYTPPSEQAGQTRGWRCPTTSLRLGRGRCCRRWSRGSRPCQRHERGCTLHGRRRRGRYGDTSHGRRRRGGQDGVGGGDMVGGCVGKWGALGVRGICDVDPHMGEATDTVEIGKRSVSDMRPTRT